MLEGYMTAKETAEKWGITQRTVQIMCNNGRIKGAQKFGNIWVIPINAQKPIDNRVVTGKYKNWRNQTKEGKKSE